MTWPFPPFPNPMDTGNKVPKFNPENYEDAPVCTKSMNITETKIC
jgi:hypothetical protein